MNAAGRLRVHPFGTGDPLDDVPAGLQRDYLRAYLHDLGSKTVIEEVCYFDRDYLSEFAAFYGTSACGYPNVCRRLHFFGGPTLHRTTIRSALAKAGASLSLRDRYNGFVVMRPLKAAPLGRTVLRWYPDQRPQTPRIMEPSRDYRVHLAGLPLSVHGLAWQQQDTAVSACATVALWSMLHSSAFDDHHAVPTTATITRLAHSRGASARRVFPSRGLDAAQICEAIREAGLEPALAAGEQATSIRGARGFRPDRFASLCAAYLRGGYPVLLGGELVELKSNRLIGRHAVCAVGFRECAPAFAAGKLVMQDAGVSHVYVHDDNIGPNVRFAIHKDSKGAVALVRSPPPGTTQPAAGASYPAFVPTLVIAAVHENLRTSNDAIQRAALKAGRAFSLMAGASVPLAVTVRLTKLATYMARELPIAVGDGPALAKARLALAEQVPPMGLHVGVARFGDPGGAVFDVVYDTTDSDRHVRAFATVAYVPVAAQLTQLGRKHGICDYGVVVRAF